MLAPATAIFAAALAAPATDTADVALAVDARLDAIVPFALANNPDLLAAREVANAAQSRGAAAGQLPDAELKSELWGVPLARPWDFSQSQTLMLGLRQAFPAPGSRVFAAKAGALDADVARENIHTRELDTTVQVRRAYFDYWRAGAELAIHREHAALADRVIELARANFRTGRASQQDVLRSIVAASQLHVDVATIEQEIASSRALLNTLMGRTGDAPLGTPAEVPLPESQPDFESLESLVESRPEIASSTRAAERSEADLERARAEATWPSFMVSADYWLMPTFASPNAYGAMVSMTLPWLNARHEDEIAAAEHAALAERRGVESAKRSALYQVRDALARYRAAKSAFALIDHEVLPQARESFESSRTAYAAGQGDALSVQNALKTFLDVRLERVRAIARVQSSFAELERAAGCDLDVSQHGELQ